MDHPEEATPTLYPRILIFIYALFFPIIGGVILLSINLKKLKRHMSILWLFIGFLLFESVHLKWIREDGLSIWTFFLPVGLGAIFLIFPIWDVLLKGTNTYKRKGVLVPLIVLLFIWVPLLLINFFKLAD